MNQIKQNKNNLYLGNNQTLKKFFLYQIMD